MRRRRRKTIYRIDIILNETSLQSLLLEVYYVSRHFYLKGKIPLARPRHRREITRILEK